MYVTKWILRRRPFFEDLFERKVDEELAQPDGFAGNFMKCRLPA